MKPFLSLKNISKKFGDKVILNNLSLDLYEGEILGLIGRSGCGKSTLIKILVGYHPADSGTILLNGESIASKEFKSLVGYTTQDNSFYEKLSIKENMAYYANLYNLDSKQRKTRIDELLKAVQLYEAKDTLAGDISGGMKRRLDFAISLLHHPKLVILDEPTTGLDPILVEEFWKGVTAIVKKQKIAVLVSSHLLSEVKAHCTKVAAMKNGEIKKILKITKDLNLEKKFKELT